MRVRGGIFLFAVGIAAGIAGTIYGPELIAPYLPEIAQRQGANFEGTVVAKKREGDRLLLTIQTQEGSILATFKEKAVETELLVSEGDLISLVLREYAPFVEDPPIARVRKKEFKEQQSPQ